MIIHQVEHLFHATPRKPPRHSDQEEHNPRSLSSAHVLLSSLTHSLLPLSVVLEAWLAVPAESFAVLATVACSAPP